MLADHKDETHIARPSGLHAALQNAAQLPLSVAAGLADEVAYQTQSIRPGRRDENVSLRQLYHESNAQMHRSDCSKAQPEQGSETVTQHQKADYPIPQLVTGHPEKATASAAAATGVVATGKNDYAKLQSADTGSTHTEHRFCPKRSVSIQDRVDVIGESAADDKAAQSHLVAAKGASSDDSNSASSSVSSPLRL